MRTAKISEVAHVTDFVASGSFASIKANVTYRSEKSYAILVRTTDYNNGWNGDYVWVDEHSFSFLSKSNLRPKDVIISNVGSIGIVFQTPDLGVPMSLAPNAIMCRSLDQDTLDQDFLYYYLKGPIGQHLIHSITSGSAQPKFNKTDFRNLEIKVPAIERQRYIGNILKSLDDKIELNSKMNETLEQMARALFKSWFVDFDPVHAKATGRQPAGMDKATADLFPDSFVDSELGKIPKGWAISTLGEDVTITRGCSYKSEDLATSSTAMVTLKSFKRGGGYRHDGLKSYTGAYKPAQVVHAGELVVSYTDVTQAAELIGRPAIVSTTPDFKQLVISQDVSVVRPKNGIPISYLYRLMMEESFRAHTYAHSTGTTVLHLSSTALPSFKFIKPKTELLAAFDKTAANLLRLADENQQQSRLLSATRDALLPKLLSGAIVPQNA